MRCTLKSSGQDLIWVAGFFAINLGKPWLASVILDLLPYTGLHGYVCIYFPRTFPVSRLGLVSKQMVIGCSFGICDTYLDLFAYYKMLSDKIN